MKEALLIAIALLLPSPSLGVMASWPSAAFVNDPALCSTTDGEVGEGCEPGPIATKLDEFPYWNHESDGWGGGTHWFLGAHRGFLWGVACQHCGRGNKTTAEFRRGPYAGRIFYNIGEGEVPLGGVYGEFGKTSVGPPWGNAARPQYHGSQLYKYQARAPETMPDIRMAPVLEDLADLEEGTLMLAIGRGLYHADTRLAWYKECSTAVGSGGGTPPACCTTERDAGRYGPATSYASTPRYPGSRHLVGYGGEGTIAGCGLPGEVIGTDSEAPLTYLGPVYDSNPAGTASWTLWEWSAGSIVDFGKNADGNEEINSFPAGRGNTSMSDAGRCWTAISKDENDWVVWAPPANLMKGHAYCSTEGVSVPAKPPLHTVSASNGDSGLVLFAYLPQRPAGDRWTYVGQGVNGYWWTLGTTVYKWQFDKWVLGIEPTADDR